MVNDNGSLKDNLIVSSSNVKSGEWNFFALDYYLDSKPSDEFKYGRFSLMLNGTIDEFVPVIDGYSFTLDSTPNYNIGFSANNTNVSLFEGYIAVLLIANNTEVGMNRLMTYYKLTKDYFSDTLMKMIIEERLIFLKQSYIQLILTFKIIMKFSHFKTI